MSTKVEYYYPLTTLTTQTNNNLKYFTCPIDAKQVNFAIDENNKGISKAYYIQNIPDANQPKFDETGKYLVPPSSDISKFVKATKYLVIEHIKPGDASPAFIVAIPICEVGDEIHLYKNANKNGGKLANSLELLNSASPNAKVKFSLEHVIASMKSFNPTGYYYDSATQTYILNAPIYTDVSFDTTKFYGGLTTIPAIGEITNEKIKRVYKKSQCTPKTKATTRLFDGLSKTESTRLIHLNIVIFSLCVILLGLLYYLYTRYVLPKYPIIFGILLLLIITIVPVYFNAVAYTEKKKTNAKDLRTEIVVARYFTLFFLLLLAGLFSDRDDLLKNIFNINFNIKISNLTINFLDEILDGIRILLQDTPLLITWSVLLGLFYPLYYIVAKV